MNLSDRFDVHDHRHGLKLLAEDRETTHLENREPFDGPDVRRPRERRYPEIIYNNRYHCPP